jgi:hypothetical protein
LFHHHHYQLQYKKLLNLQHIMRHHHRLNYMELLRHHQVDLQVENILLYYQYLLVYQLH